MEILTLLRLNGKRLTALATVGALTGAVAAAAVSRQAATYQASTTVFVSQALPDGASSFDVSPLVSDFQTAVILPQVRQSAADKLQLTLDDMVVAATRNGSDGGSVEVVAEADNPPDAEAVSQTVSTEAMRFLAQREVDRANKFHEERQSAVDEAQATRDQLLADYGFANPMSTYADTSTRLNQLTLDKSDPTKNLTNEQRVAADAEATRLRLQLPALRQSADDFGTAEAVLADANELLKDAEQRQTLAQEVMAASTTSVSISAGETVEASKLATMLQAFAAAVVATFVAGIAFFFVADNARSRQPKPASRPAPSAAAAPPSDAAGATAATKPGAGARTAASTGPTGAGGPSNRTDSAARAGATTKADARPDTAQNGKSERSASYQPATLDAVEAALEVENASPARAEAPSAEKRPTDPRPGAPRQADGETAPAKSGRDDTQSVFARPSDSGVKTAVEDGPPVVADPSTGNRGRKSASNRRRLGS